MNNSFVNVSFTQRFIFLLEGQLKLILFLSFTLLAACNPAFQEELADLENGSQRVNGNFTLSLHSTANSSQPQFTVRGDLKKGQKIRLYTGNNCERLRDEKTVSSISYVRLYSNPLINNGLYVYKIRVVSREGDISPCLGTTVRYSFSNGYQLPAPTVGSTGSNFERDPLITVTGAQAGNAVSFYTDASCSEFIGSEIAAANGTASRRPQNPLPDGEYKFYAKTTINGESIQCSESSSTYTIDSKVKSPILIGGITETDNKNVIRAKFSNLILNSKVYVYLNSPNCTATPIIETAKVTDPSTFQLTIGQKADLSYIINAEGTFRFNFTQEVFPGSGPSNVTPCSTDQLVYNYDITPKNAALKDGFPTITNKLFSPGFQFDNFNNDSTIKIYRNNNCSGAPLTTYNFPASADGTIVISPDLTNNSLIGQPDGTYQYTMRQTIAGVDSGCSSPVNYTINTLPTLRLATGTTSPSSNPFPKFAAGNIASDQSIEIFENNNCSGPAISNSNYTLTNEGVYTVINFTTPQTVTASPVIFSIKQTITEAPNPARVSECSDTAAVDDSVSYHVDSSSFNAGYGAGQLASGFDTTPSFTFSNTLENSQVQIFQEATITNCQTPGSVPDEFVNTGTTANLTYDVTTPLTTDGLHKYFIREFLELGANDYYSSCYEVKYRLDTYPKNFTITTPSPNHILRPQFKAVNINDPSNFELIRSVDADCSTAGDNTVMGIDLATDSHSANGTWFFQSTSDLGSEGSYYFFLRNTNMAFPAGCSNSGSYTLDVTPVFALANNTTSGTNDFLPDIKFTNIKNGFFLRYYVDDDCTTGEYADSPEDMTGEGVSTFTKELDLRNTITSDGTIQISAKYTNGAFSSKCVAIDYAINGSIKTITQKSPGLGGTRYDFNPEYSFSGLIPDTQVQLYSSQADCNSGTDIFTSLPAVTNATGDGFDFTFDVTADVPSILPGPITDQTLEVWARQYRSSNGYVSTCVQAPSYSLNGTPTHLTSDLVGTIRTAPYFAIDTSYDGATDVELRLFSDDTCSTPISGDGTSVNAPGISFDTYAFLVDYEGASFPFSRSGSYDIYSQVFRDDPTNTEYSGTYLSTCKKGNTYTFDGIPNNIRFTTTSIQTGVDTFGGNEIPVINTPTPAFLVDNIIDHADTNVAMHIDRRDGGGATNNQCSPLYAASVHDTGYSGSGYRIENGVIPGDGIYTVYFKQEVGNYNLNSPNFDCSEGFTFKVSGIPEDIAFATTNFAADISADERLYIDDNIYDVLSIADDFNFTLTSNALTTKQQTRMTKIFGAELALAGNVSYNSGTSTVAVTGTGTQFNTQLSIGDIIIISGTEHVVEAISSNTALEVSTATPVAGTVNNVTALRRRHNGSTITGTVEFNSGTSTTAVIGTGTSFLTEVFAGDIIRINNSYHRIASITDDTNLVIAATTPLSGSPSGKKATVFRAVIPGFASIETGSAIVTGSTTLSPDNDLTPGVVIDGMGADLHIRIYGIRDADYSGTPNSICSDGDAFPVSDFIDTDYSDDSISNVQIGSIKQTTVPIDLGNLLMTSDDKFHFAARIVGETVEDTPDPGAFDDCTPEKLDYILEGTPGSISIVGETGLTINNHRPTFNFSNLVKGRDITLDHSVRAFHGNGDQATAKTNCEANASHYAANSGGGLVTDTINGAAEFTGDGTFFVYFRQFHNKDAGGADDYASDCIYDETTPGNGIFSFTLDGELKNPTLISPATQPSDELTLTIQVENYRKSAGRSIQVYNDVTKATTCGGAVIETIPDAAITEVSPGLFQFTMSRLTDLLAISDFSNTADLVLFFNQIEDGYTSDCSTSFVQYNLAADVEMHFQGDPEPEEKDFTSTDPTPGLVLDMDTVINDADNTLEFFLTSNCTGVPIDSIANPHASGRINGSGVMSLNGLSADGNYNIYVRQVLAETNSFTGRCSQAHSFTLEYDVAGGFVTAATSTFPLNPRYNVITAEDGLDINVYLNLDGLGPNCDPANLVSVKNNVMAGTSLVDDIYLIQDGVHQFHIQLDDDAAYTSACIAAENARYELDGRPTALTVSAGSTGRDPTPTFDVSGIMSLSGTSTIVELYTSPTCNSGFLGSRSALPADISSGVLAVTTNILSEDKIYTVYTRQIHDAGSNGYDAGTDYVSNCSNVSFSYTLDGKPKNVISTGSSSPSSDPNPSFQLKNIFNDSHEVQAFPSKAQCEAGANAITLISNTHDGNETANVTLGLEDDGTYQISFRQRRTDGSYVSKCTDTFEYTLDRKPSGITFNSATNVLEPSFDVTGTVADFNVFLYTSLEDGGDGCDVLRGSTGGSNGTTTVTANSVPISLDGDYKFYARMIKTAGIGDTKTGTVAFNSGVSTTQVNGTGTQFTLEIDAQDLININGNFYTVANVIDNTTLNVEASTPLAGTVTGKSIAVHEVDETACSDTSADYNVDLKPNNISFDSGNPGKEIRPEISMNSLIQGTTVHLYYINKPTDIFEDFNAASGCPAALAPANPDDPAVTYLGAIVDSNNDGDIESNTPIPSNLPSDADSIYPIYAYQTDGIYASKCNFLGEYTLDVKPGFPTNWLVQQNQKNDVIDIRLDNLVSGSSVEIFYDGCDISDRIASFSNITGLVGDTKTFNIDLGDRLGANLVDNTTLRFFASQTLPSGFESGCSTLTSASYFYNSSPIVTAVDASGTAEKEPVLTVTEILQATPRSVKIYAVADGADPCAGGNQVVFDGTINYNPIDPNVTNDGDGTFSYQLDLSSVAGATPFVNDGTYTFRAEQTLDSGRTSGCYITDDSAEYTLNSKPTLSDMTPAGGFGSTTSPSFNLNANEFSGTDGYEIDVYVNDLSCSGAPHVDNWTNNTAVDISGLTAGFTSNYVFFTFKFVDPAGEHTGTTCSDRVTYDFNALELDLITASPDPNDDLSPLIEVHHVNPNDTIRLYADSGCSNEIASVTVSGATPADSSIFIETDPLNTDGTFSIHATRQPSGGNETLCSLDFVNYQIDVDPTSFTFSGGGNVGVDDTPTFNIVGVLDDAQINLYRDENCTQLAGIASTPFGVNNVNITSSQLPADGLYEFHITQNKASNGFISRCSTVYAEYTLLSKPTNVSLLQNNPASDPRPYLRVEGVAENATVRLFKDEGDGGSPCDTEIGDELATGTTVDVRVDAGVLTATTTIDIYARHEVGVVVGSCSDAFVSYNYDTTAKDWSVTHAQRVNDFVSRFGNGVAVDNNITIVGEPYYNGTGDKQGRVRIFEKNGSGVWIEQDFFQASNTEDGDQFGHAVDVYYNNGDSTYYIIVSAPYHDTTGGNDNRGSIYVFTYKTVPDPNVLDQIAVITPFDPADNDAIGHSVAIFNNTLAYSTITKNSNKGKVYYYRSNAGQFDYALETGVLPDDAASKFGTDISLNGTHLVVGAPNAEKVYVYEVNNAMAKTVLEADAVVVGDDFGFSVAHNDDNIIVGIPGSANDQGKINIFDFSDLSASPTQISEGSPSNNNRFGHKVDISSLGALAVSAPGASSKAGKAYIYEGAAYDVITNVTGFDVSSNYDYGSNLCFSSDGLDLAITAPSYNSAVKKPGLYIHSRP